MKINKGINMKLNIQPIFGALVHEYVFEGPCRFGSGDQLSQDYDQMVGGESFKNFKENLNSYFDCEQFNILEPVYYERTEEFLITDEVMKDITKNDNIADCYVYASPGRHTDIVINLAEKVKKPIISMQFCCNNTTIVAALRARELEGYAFTTWEETVTQLKVLRVRKVLKESRFMLATRDNSTMAAASSGDGFISLEQITKNFGTHFKFVNIHELLDQIKIVDPTSNPTTPGRICLNINEDDMAIIEKKADELIAGSSECTLDKEYIVNSLKGYTIVKKLLERYDCNAFSIPCPEACASMRLNKEKLTFCFTHSLLNEEGIPSACEYDIPGLFSMLVLSNFSMSAPYLGNCVSVTLKNDNKTPLFKMVPPNGLEEKILGFDDETRKNLMLTFHSVPNRKLKGFNTEESPYALRPFTGSGWGTTMRYDFSRDKDQIITMARFSPDGKSLFVAKGTIVGSVGENLNGCTQGVLFKVNDRNDFFNKQLNFGNHLPLVYGDYCNEVIALGKMLGLDIVTA